MDKVFYIGEVEKKFNIGKKTLRYYDQIELLCPSKNPETGYRFYSNDDLSDLQKIKYLKETGFELKEIKNFISSIDLNQIDDSLDNQINKMNKMELELKCKKKALKDWKGLLDEARLALKYNLNHINIKFLENEKYIFLEQEFDGNYNNLIINGNFNTYIENINNKITGPVIIEYPSLNKRINGDCKNIRFLQKNLLDCDINKTFELGDSLYASCYHIGSHDSLNDTHKKIKEWLEVNNYKYDQRVYERYILDQWTIKNEESFVTEILIKLLK